MGTTPPPVVDLDGLASLLGVSDAVAAELLASASVPYLSIRGEPRFVVQAVLAWLAEQRGELLPEIKAAPEPEVPRPPRRPLSPAGPGEHPFVSHDDLEALAGGATDAGRNLDRLRLRDALLELNDALLPALTRLSGGRLHPHHDEKARTSPWRVGDADEGRIRAMSIAWGGGDGPPAGFVDRPRVEVELAWGELRVALLAPRGLPTLDGETLDGLVGAGIAYDPVGGGDTPVAAKVYPLAARAPSMATVAGALIDDLTHLVPLWLACQKAA